MLILCTQLIVVPCMQWLVFRKDGSATAAAWAQKAARATAEGRSVGDGEFMDIFEPQKRIYRRRAFAQTILRNTMQVLRVHFMWHRFSVSG